MKVIYGTEGSNSYIIYADKNCVIDPGFNTGFGIHLDSIGVVINTHGHADHILNNFLFKKAKVYAHELDLPSINRGEHTYQEFYGVRVRAVNAKPLGSIVDLGSKQLQVIHTPGHTKGSVSIYDPEEKVLYCGDLCFKHGVGRTDVYGGDEGALLESLRKVSDLDFRILAPGHGPLGDKDSVLQAVWSLEHQA